MKKIAIEGGGHRVKTAFAPLARFTTGLARGMKPGGLGRKLLKSPMAMPAAGMGLSMMDNPLAQTAGTAMMFMGGKRTPAAQRRKSPAKNLPSLTKEQRGAASRRYWAKQQGQKSLF